MKRKYKVWTCLVALIFVTISSCKKQDFVDLNTNPQLIDQITPEQEFMDALIRLQNERLEWYYDNVRGIMPWMQMNTPQNGNGDTFISDAANFRNARYNMFYPGIGASLTDVEHIISEMSAEEQAKRVHELAITGIVKAYYAFYVSDVSGSIPYTEAFQGKYGGTFTPKYNTQEELFTILDEQLKTNIATLESSPAVAQTSFGNKDLFFDGAAAQWAKTGNAIRLRIAMRLMKRNPAEMTTRALEVLADAGNLMTSNEDSWTFETNSTYAAGGDWSVNTFRGAKNMVDFMYDNSDPRMKYFYQPNYYTEENFNLAKAQGKIPANAVYDTRRYYGVPANPETSALPANDKFFNSITISKTVASGNVADVDLDTLANLQPRLFAAGEPYGSVNGDGTNYFPIVTYADFCFMRAELAARGITADAAKEWYDKGITASINMYDDMASGAKIIDREGVSNYVATDAAEITAYLAKPAIAYNPAKGVDQIACQAYLHFFKQPNEAWSLYKRTGYPNATSVLPLERIIVGGAEQQIPRRALLTFPSPTNLNYQNILDAYTEMQKDPDFGTGISDIFGRVWWDKK